VQNLVDWLVLAVTSVPVPARPAGLFVVCRDCMYGATMPSRVAMLASFSAQLSAADISVRENSRVTKGPCGCNALPAVASPARGACAGAPAAAPAAGTSAIAAATAAAMSSPRRLLRACFLSRSAVMMATFLDEFLLRGATVWHRGLPCRATLKRKPLGSARLRAGA